MTELKIFQKKQESAFPEKSLFELVELKGQGHPDTLADTIATQLAIDYSNWWLENGGCKIETIPHYNFDKLLIAGGETKKKWGGGTTLEPAKVTLAGNGTTSLGEITIPLDKIAEQVVKKVVTNNIHPHFSFKAINRISSSSIALSQNYSNTILRSNDTSFGSGHHPNSPLEELVLTIDERLRELRSEMPWLGSDVKTMGKRIKDNYHFTIAAAFIDQYIQDETDYLEKKRRLEEEISLLIPERAVLKVNQNDKEGAQGIENYYLTVTGSSAEQDDPGEIGRSNRVTGYIAPLRQQSLEAIAGKNLIRHIGGFFNFWAKEIAKKIWEKYSIASQVILLCKIGQPIQKPQVFVTLLEQENISLQSIVLEVVEGHLEMVQEILNGKRRDFYPLKYLP